VQEKHGFVVYKEDSAGTQQEDSAVRAACPVWRETGVAAASVPGPFRKLAEDLWPTRNGSSLFEFMGLVLDAWQALGSKHYPQAWVKRKADLPHSSAKQEPERQELEAIPWQK
jgi:hypothetical protein